MSGTLNVVDFRPWLISYEGLDSLFTLFGMAACLAVVVGGLLLAQLLVNRARRQVRIWQVKSNIQRGLYSAEKVNSLDEEGLTPLFRAVSDGAYHEAVWLLDHGADPNRGCSASPLTCLIRAVLRQDARMARMLLSRGAKVNGKAGPTPGGSSLTDRFEWDRWNDTATHATALHFAAGSGNAEMVKLLLAHGAKVNAWSYNRSTPLHWAASRNRLEVALVLLEHGANVVAPASDGSTPLSWAPIGTGSGVVWRLLRDLIVLCPSCQKEQPAEAKECRHCGWRLRP